MQVILISNRLAKTRRLNITPALMMASATAFLIFALATSFLFSWLGVRLNLPFVSDMVNSVQEVHQRKNEEFLRENIAAMAVKLGEMQARVTRLDLLGERVAKQSGVSVPKSEVHTQPTTGGSGGPLIRPSQPLSLDELQREISKLSQVVEQRDEDLTAIESQLMERRIKATLLPTLMPIQAQHIGHQLLLALVKDPGPGPLLHHQPYFLIAHPTLIPRMGTEQSQQAMRGGGQQPDHEIAHVEVGQNHQRDRVNNEHHRQQIQQKQPHVTF